MGLRWLRVGRKGNADDAAMRPASGDGLGIETCQSNSRTRFVLVVAQMDRLRIGNQHALLLLFEQVRLLPDVEGHERTKAQPDRTVI